MTEIDVGTAFTLDDLLAAVQQSEQAEGFYTRQEWQRKLGVHTATVMCDLLHMVQDAGLLDVARARRDCLDGVVRTVPVYRIRLKEEG